MTRFAERRFPNCPTTCSQSSADRFRRSRIGGACFGTVPRLPGFNWRPVQSSNCRYSLSVRAPVFAPRCSLQWLAPVFRSGVPGVGRPDFSDFNHVELKRSYVFGGCFQRRPAKELGKPADVIRVSIDRALRKVAELHVVCHLTREISDAVLPRCHGEIPERLRCENETTHPLRVSHLHHATATLSAIHERIHQRESWMSQSSPGAQDRFNPGISYNLATTCSSLLRQKLIPTHEAVKFHDSDHRVAGDDSPLETA